MGSPLSPKFAQAIATQLWSSVGTTHLVNELLPKYLVFVPSAANADPACVKLGKINSLILIQTFSSTLLMFAPRYWVPFS